MRLRRLRPGPAHTARTDRDKFDPTNPDAVNARSRASSESSRDIAADGWVHEAKDVDRRAKAQKSFRFFCEEHLKLPKKKQDEALTKWAQKTA